MVTVIHSAHPVSPTLPQLSYALASLEDVFQLLGTVGVYVCAHVGKVHEVQVLEAVSCLVPPATHEHARFQCCSSFHTNECTLTVKIVLDQ